MPVSPVLRALSVALFSVSIQASITTVNLAHHLQNGCKIHSLANTSLLKVFPGERCLFFPDGSFVSQTTTEMKLLAPNDEVRWTTTNPFFHHQLNLSEDGQRLLVLSSGEKETFGDLYRIDTLSLVDLKTGATLKSIDSDDLLKQTNLPPVVFENAFPRLSFKTNKEASHFNSFYEIPKFKTTAKDPVWLKPGYFIANSTWLGIFVLNADLTKVVHHFEIKGAFTNSVHDVQITNRGTLLAFVNNNFNIERIPHSAVLEYDPRINKELVRIEGSPKAFFYSKYCGGVQDIGNDNIFFSHHFAGAYIYNKKSKKITYSNYSIYKEGLRLLPTQQIKILDLSKFLDHRKAPVF